MLHVWNEKQNEGGFLEEEILSTVSCVRVRMSALQAAPNLRIHSVGITFRLHVILDFRNGPITVLVLFISQLFWTYSFLAHIHYFERKNYSYEITLLCVCLSVYPSMSLQLSVYLPPNF
jgi:hypothetical protein